METNTTDAATWQDMFTVATALISGPFIMFGVVLIVAVIMAVWVTVR